MFSIFTRQMSKNLGFVKSKLTTGEYRKHGFIEVGEKNPRHPRFRSGQLRSKATIHTKSHASFVLILRYGATLKAIRYESSLYRIVANKSHRVTIVV